MKRPHLYLADPLDVSDEAGYRIEEGVILDVEDRPTARRAYGEFTRYWQPSKEDRLAEEARWAALSGPCITIKEGRTAS
jgi:hypothetical protein